MSQNLNYFIEMSGVIVIVAIAMMHGSQFAQAMTSASTLFNKVVNTTQGR